MPIAVGTEMNRAGLPFVDDFSAPELRPFVPDFLEGASCLYGLTLLARYADFGYLSGKASAAFGDATRAKNAFFTEVGRCSIPTADKLARLGELSEPKDILALLHG